LAREFDWSERPVLEPLSLDRQHYDDALSGGRETRLYSLVLSASGHDLSLANILYGPHHRGFNASAFAAHGLQFYEDGRKIAAYPNTLPGSFSLLREIVG